MQAIKRNTCWQDQKPKTQMGGTELGTLLNNKIKAKPSRDGGMRRKKAHLAANGPLKVVEV